MRISADKYVARIANATQIQLVVINYEIVLDYINAAKNSADNKEDHAFNVTKARQFIGELRNALDMSYTISKYLMNLYNYADQELAYALFSYKAEKLENAQKVLEKLLTAWVKIESDDKEKVPVMENVEQLYAGLTYGKDGSLNEYVDTDVQRGFKA